MHFSGKKILFGLLVILFLGRLSLPAHAPEKITLAFDGSPGILQVTVLHPVKNPESHYIKRIRIYVNDEPVAEKAFEKQDTSESQDADFTLKGVKSGDEIKAKAFCNRIGAKKTSIIVK